MSWLINEAKADLSAVAGNGVTVFLMACSSASLALVKDLAARAPSAHLELQDGIGRTPMSAASAHNRVETMKFLVLTGCSVREAVSGQG